MKVDDPYSKPRKTALPLAPAMPSLGKFVEGEWGSPLTAREPAKAYTPFSRVDDRRPQEIRRLADALAAYLVSGLSSWPSSRKPTLPTTNDRLTAQLIEESFALGGQAVAAANNIALLAASLSRLTTGRTELSGEEIEEAWRISSAILHLTQA